MSYSIALAQAIAVVTYVAFKMQYGQYEFVPTRDIAQALNLAAPTVVKLLQSLSRAGIIETREGAKGGISLARPPEAISLFDVFYAIEQDRPLFRLDLKMRLQNEQAGQYGLQRVRAAFGQAEAAMKAELRAVTIADLLQTRG